VWRSWLTESARGTVIARGCRCRLFGLSPIMRWIICRLHSSTRFLSTNEGLFLRLSSRVDQRLRACLSSCAGKSFATKRHQGYLDTSRVTSLDHSFSFIRFTRFVCTRFVPSPFFVVHESMGKRKGRKRSPHEALATYTCTFNNSKTVHVSLSRADIW
jgi:hypothetical protein